MEMCASGVIVLEVAGWPAVWWKDHNLVRSKPARCDAMSQVMAKKQED